MLPIRKPSSEETRTRFVQTLRGRSIRTAPGRFAVYVAVNTQNNKVYVGATSIGVERRKRTHVNNARRGAPGKFYTAIRKYGIDAFEFLTFGVTYSWERTLDIERELISILGATADYNTTNGGGGSFGYVWSQASKDKLRSSLIQHYADGTPSPRKGNKLSEKQCAAVASGAKAGWAKIKADPERFAALRAQRRKTMLARYGKEDQ